MVGVIVDVLDDDLDRELNIDWIKSSGPDCIPDDGGYRTA
jgi:hypothetical protein